MALRLRVWKLPLESAPTGEKMLLVSQKCASGSKRLYGKYLIDELENWDLHLVALVKSDLVALVKLVLFIFFSEICLRACTSMQELSRMIRTGGHGGRRSSLKHTYPYQTVYMFGSVLLCLSSCISFGLF